jgi:hypothetical protein
LRTMISNAPKRRMLNYIDVTMTSDDLYVASLLEEGHIGPIWKDLNKEKHSFHERKSKSARCPLLQVSDGVALAAFFVVASDEWMTQLQPEKYVINYDLLKSARTTIKANFSLQVGGVSLADAELNMSIGGMGKGPVRGHVKRLFKTIFASYAPSDLHMVQLTESILRIAGLCELTWDTKVASPGSSRKEAVCAAISDSDVFQLFWSEQARLSGTVRDEWKYALSLRREGFVRPVYWDDKLPEPPKELRRLFFSKILCAQIAHVGVLESLSALLGTRPTINIERMEYMEKQINVASSGQGNVVNVAEYMVDVVNAVNQNVSESHAADDLKDLVRQLADRIAELAPKIDPALAEQMGGDVRTLSEEMRRQQRPAWYKLALEGIKEGAKTIGEIGKPILEITAKLLPLLLPG